MILKVGIAVAIAVFVLIAVPSIIATFTLLIKSIESSSEKRRRPTYYHR